MDLKLSSSKMMSLASLAISVPEMPIEKPTSALLKAGASKYLEKLGTIGTVSSDSDNFAEIHQSCHQYQFIFRGGSCENFELFGYGFESLHILDLQNHFPIASGLCCPNQLT
jgi:hypothetical protein